MKAYNAVYMYYCVELKSSLPKVTNEFSSVIADMGVFNPYCVKVHLFLHSQLADLKCGGKTISF